MFRLPAANLNREANSFPGGSSIRKKNIEKSQGVSLACMDYLLHHTFQIPYHPPPHWNSFIVSNVKKTTISQFHCYPSTERETLIGANPTTSLAWRTLFSNHRDSKLLRSYKEFRAFKIRSSSRISWSSTVSSPDDLWIWFPSSVHPRIASAFWDSIFLNSSHFCPYSFQWLIE